VDRSHRDYSRPRPVHEVVLDLLNSTGYATADFVEWAGSGTNAQFVLLFAMFIGGSAGSTGGGVKVVRWLVVVTSHRPRD
jgi:trk system potassium uptake protein TrkH